MKKMKSYRLSSDTLKCLSDLLSWSPEMTETEIVEKAISMLYDIELSMLYDIELGTATDDNIYFSIRSLSGELFKVSRFNY